MYLQRHYANCPQAKRGMVYKPYEELEMMKKQCFDPNGPNAALIQKPIPPEQRT